MVLGLVSAELLVVHILLLRVVLVLVLQMRALGNQHLGPFYLFGCRFDLFTLGLVALTVIIPVLLINLLELYDEITA